MEFNTFERDGRFGVSYRTDHISYGSDIGRGSMEKIAAFPTEGERAMYILQVKLYTRLENLEHERDFYLAEAQKATTVRGAWRNLRIAIRKAIRS